MKRLLSIALCCFLLLLSACSNGSPAPSPTPTPSASPSPSPTPSASPMPPVQYLVPLEEYQAAMALFEDVYVMIASPTKPDESAEIKALIATLGYEMIPLGEDIFRIESHYDNKTYLIVVFTHVKVQSVSFYASVQDARVACSIDAVNMQANSYITAQGSLHWRVEGVAAQRIFLEQAYQYASDGF